MNADLSIEQFIQKILLEDVRRMTYDCQLHYLAFGVIAVGIEFLGACEDSEPFHTKGKSNARFEAGIETFMRPVNPFYSEYNKDNSPFYLYKQLRCGMAHLLRPQGEIGFMSRTTAKQTGLTHLGLYKKSKLIMVAEACHQLLRGALVTGHEIYTNTLISGPFERGGASFFL